MKESDRRARNASRLTELHPWMRRRVAAVIAQLEAWGRRPRIQEAWRSIADQARAEASGNSGVTFGYHNVTSPDGRPESFAVDLLDDDDPLDRDPTEPGRVYFLLLAIAAERNGLTTLIRWGLNMAERAQVDAAISTGDSTAPVRIGKDPTHVQPGSASGITIDRLRSGWRPDGGDITGAAVSSIGSLAVSELRTAPEPPPPTPSLGDAIQLSSELGPLPAPHEVGGWGSQLESYLRELDRGRKFSDFGHSAQEEMRNWVPRWILEAARMRMLRIGAAHGLISAESCAGFFVRRFGVSYVSTADVLAKLAWWGTEAMKP